MNLATKLLVVVAIFLALAVSAVVLPANAIPDEVGTAGGGVLLLIVIELYRRCASLSVALQATNGRVDELELAVIAVRPSSSTTSSTPDDLFSTNVQRALRSIRETSEDARRRANEERDHDGR